MRGSLPRSRLMAVLSYFEAKQDARAMAAFDAVVLPQLSCRVMNMALDAILFAHSGL